MFKRMQIYPPFAKGEPWVLIAGNYAYVEGMNMTVIEERGVTALHLPELGETFYAESEAFKLKVG